jgi:hypothetical protein
MYRTLFVLGTSCLSLLSVVTAQKTTNLFPSIVQMVSEANTGAPYPNTAGTRNTFFVASNGYPLQCCSGST